MAMIKIKCPYCFEDFENDNVHFRSEFISKEDDNPLPEEYTDINDYKEKMQRLDEKIKDNQEEGKPVSPDDQKKFSDKDRIMSEYEDWAFFSVRPDPKYEEFWSKYNGTTEQESPADKRNQIKTYERPIISCSLLAERNIEYELLPQDFNETGKILEGIKMKGAVTRKRVCPHCHNPLPEGYGKNPVKYIAVVGITQAGKTVYLSQLLRKIDLYAEKVGLTIDENSLSIRNFIEANFVEANEELPGGTEKDSLQQPLFYDLSISRPNGIIEKETLVMYDVAGESFEHKDLVDKFAPFVEHADGVILLVPPSQLTVMERIGITQKTKARPKAVLGVIKDRINHGDDNTKIKLQVAVCISQADLIMKDELITILGRELIDNLRNDAQGVKDPNGRYIKEFNARHYNPIGKGLNDFFNDYGDGLASYMNQQYDNYAWFAFTSLGCSVTDKPVESENGEKKVSVPVGPINPKHVEDPLLWLFYRFGYIGTNEKVFSPGEPLVSCPECGSSDIIFRDTKVTEVVEQEKKNLLSKFLPFKGKEKQCIEYDTICSDCGHKWLRETK